MFVYMCVPVGVGGRGCLYRWVDPRVDLRVLEWWAIGWVGGLCVHVNVPSLFAPFSSKRRFLVLFARHPHQFLKCAH